MLGGERPQQHGRQIDHAHALERSRHFPSLFQSLRLAIGDLVEPMAFAAYTISSTLATTTASWTTLTSMPFRCRTPKPSHRRGDAGFPGLQLGGHELAEPAA